MNFVNREHECLPTPFTQLVAKEENNAKARQKWYRQRSRSKQAFSSSQFHARQEQQLIEAGVYPNPSEDPRRFNWLIVDHPRFAGNACKVEQCRSNMRVAYDNTGHTLTRVPRALEFGVTIQRPPQHGNANEMTLTVSARAFLWLVIDSRHVHKKNILDDVFYGTHFQETTEGMVCVGNGNPDYWCIYKSRQPWSKGSSIKLAPLMAGLVNQTNYRRGIVREPILVVTRADDERSQPTDFQSNISEEEASFQAARERALSRQRGGGGSKSGGSTGRGGGGSKSGGGGGGKTSSRTPTLSSAARPTPEEGQSSVVLDDDQLVLLHALNASDLKSMCYHRGVDSHQITGAGNDKNNLIQLLRENSEKQKSNRGGNASTGSRGSSGKSSSSGGSRGGNNSQRSGGSADESSGGSSFLRRGTGNGGGGINARRTVSPVYRNNIQKSTNSSTNSSMNNMTPKEREEQAEQERLLEYYALRAQQKPSRRMVAGGGWSEGHNRNSNSTTATTTTTTTTTTNTGSNSGNNEWRATVARTERQQHRLGSPPVARQPAPVAAPSKWEAIVLHAFSPMASGDNQEQIRIEAGQTLQVLQLGKNGWTRGTNVASGETGWFPTAYVSLGEDPQTVTTTASGSASGSATSSALAAAAARRSRIYR